MVMSYFIFVLTVSLTVCAFSLTDTAIAQATEDITIIPINDEISLQRTIAIMNIPEDNKLPWGLVKGKPSDYVERYPVIIQFFKEGEPVHVAQVNVKGDGSYEYKFRIRNIDNNTGQIIDIFEGQYTVKIFKVIHNQDNTISH